MEKQIEKQAIEEMAKTIEEMAFDLCLIDRCKHLPQEECNNTTCAHCEAEALYNAGYRKQEWISVEERLPDNHRTVLVACKGITVAGAAPIAVGSYGGGHWFLADAEGTLYLTKYMHIVVTHWMPLPEPPKMKGGAE